MSLSDNSLKRKYEDVSGSGWVEAIAKEWTHRHGETLESKYEERFKYPLIARAFSTEEVQAMVSVILSGQLTMSKHVKQFEKDFAEWVGSPYAVMVNSGSSANLLAMAVATNPARGDRQVMKGSECLIPAVCWSTSLWPVIQMGLIPIFVDVDPTTLNIDTADMQRKITKNTSSIVLVHVLGNAPNMDDVMSIVKAQNLMMLEDTCETLGGDFKGKQTGTFGDFGSFSFYYSHHITTGEGGMVVCNNKEDYELLKVLRAHGWSRELHNKAELEKQYPKLDHRFLFVNVGYNLRPMEVSAAMGILQLKRLKDMNRIRNANHDLIEDAIKANPKFQGQFDFVQPPSDGYKPAWFGFSALVNKRFAHQTPDFLAYLTEKGIENRPIISGNFANQPGLKLFKIDVKPEDYPGAEEIGKRGFFFGIHVVMLTDDQIKYITETVNDFPWDPKEVILVTGGSGLVGTALKEFSEKQANPQEDWVFLASGDGDLRDIDQTRAIFRKHRPTHVIHLAVLLMGGHSMKDSKVELWEYNNRMNENVLKVSREFSVQKLVSCLSSFAYPLELAEVADESTLHSGLPHGNIETYAMSKRILDVLSRSYRDQYGSNFITVLPTNIFGPSAGFRTGGPIIEGVISRTLQAVETGGALQLYGTGAPKRQFLYSKDCAALMYWALRNYNESETINFVGDEIPIGDCVKQVIANLEYKGKTDTDTSRPDGPLTRTLDGSKLAKLYPGFKATPFEQALKETCDWSKVNNPFKK